MVAGPMRFPPAYGWMVPPAATSLDNATSDGGTDVTEASRKYVPGASAGAVKLIGKVLKSPGPRWSLTEGTVVRSVAEEFSTDVADE
jgi:hypothetical protein